MRYFLLYKAIGRFLRDFKWSLDKRSPTTFASKNNPKGGVVIRRTGQETVGSHCKDNTSQNKISDKTDQLFIRRPNNQCLRS